MKNSLYLDALLDLDTAATATEIHARAVELFGDQVSGGVDSVRNSLNRYLLQGKVERHGRGRYYATQLAADPIGALETKLRAAQTEIKRLRELLERNG